MNEPPQKPEALVEMRTHLTVLILAVGQLRRRYGDTADIQRLCRYAETSLDQLRDDIATMEALLGHYTGREASRLAHQQRRQSLAANSYFQETGLPPLPSHSSRRAADE